jgi:hypothetical protein
MDIDLELASYLPYAIHAIVVGAVIIGLAQEHRALALYCIVIATLAVISYVWEEG